MEREARGSKIKNCGRKIKLRKSVAIVCEGNCALHPKKNTHGYSGYPVISGTWCGLASVSKDRFCAASGRHWYQYHMNRSHVLKKTTVNRLSSTEAMTFLLLLFRVVPEKKQNKTKQNKTKTKYENKANKNRTETKNASLSSYSVLPNGFLTSMDCFPWIFAQLDQRAKKNFCQEVIAIVDDSLFSFFLCFHC